MNLIKSFLIIIIGPFILSGCQVPPTKIKESDASIEGRAFSRITFDDKGIDFKRVVIVDVRSRFDFEMSKLPRSFNAYWKDWDLRGFTGPRLEQKVKELQRLLSLKGVDPLTQVVILGKGLKGQGEEFLIATTLLSLGIERISFINEKKAKDAIQSKKMPKLENIPYWSKPAGYAFNCNRNKMSTTDRRKQSDVIIESSKKDGSLQVSQVFNENLELKPRSYPKNIQMQFYSPETLWAYGLALHFKNQGRQPCVL